MVKVSLTARMAIIFMLVVTIVLSIAAVSFNYFCRIHFEHKDAEVLNSKASALARTLKSGEVLDQGMTQKIDTLIDNSFGFAAVIVVSGKTAYSHHDLSESLLPLVSGLKSNRWTIDLGVHQYSGVTKKITGWAGDEDAVIHLALDVTHRVHFFNMIREWFAYTLIVSALLSGALGFTLIKRGLQPISNLSKTSSTITANCLDTRISTESVPGELHELVDNFNAMLVRLDESFLRLSGFSADIAHELRTPLNSMLTQIEVALMKDRDNADYKDIIFSALEELRRMSRMVDDMLFLAKADNGMIVPNLEVKDIAETAASVLEFYEFMAEEKGIGLRLTGSAPVEGDISMLRRALSNIMSNALRYGEPGTDVEIDIKQERQWVNVDIRNWGVTIPAEHLSRLFDRFYRVDSARREGSTMNAGLGMSITRSIIEAHGGQIACYSSDGRTTFSIKLQRAA
jgi:two-component system heavy metal sensor histidine kinase CusS